MNSPIPLADRLLVLPHTAKAGTVPKFLLPIAAIDFSRAALAADEAVANAPTELVDVIYVVIFGIIFIGMIVGFFVYWWWVERKRKEKEK